MITDKVIWQDEKAYLEKVANELKIQLSHGMDVVSSYKKDAIDFQKQMWEDIRCAPTSLSDLEAPVTIWQYQTELSNQARKYKFSYNKVERLERMVQSPYFGRIDFIEDGEEVAERIYIGIHSLSKGNMREILIYDWRAPISGMFYDYEIGPSSYNCPAGCISGQMLLKRQYKIEKNEIVYMFDSSLSINDEMLREILGKSTDNRMKNIVTSIQREQNTVIRNSQDQILIVEGPAGSGKTSIALHRAAYLLYKYRDSMKSENILVFSPNHVFEDYVSNVLPELGEENIQRSTFGDFFGTMLETKYRMETMNQQMESILSGACKDIRLQCIQFKGSVGFLNILNQYVEYLESGRGIVFKDLFYHGSLVISAHDMYELIRNDYSRFTYAKRLEKLRQRLFYLLEQCDEERVRLLAENNSNENRSIHENKKLLKDKKTEAEYESLREEITQMTSFDIYLLYTDMLNRIEAYAETDDEQAIEKLQSVGRYTIRQMNQGILHYEDLAPLIFLKSVLDAGSDTKSIKHVVVDEAQDYTVIHFEILKKVFAHCNMTILGDINQSVNGYMNIGSFDRISGIFNNKNTRSISLTKSYRSSKEIADFCREILRSENPSEQLNRHGNKPKIIQVDKKNVYQRMAEDIAELQGRNHQLIAVICKTAAKCESLYHSMKSLVEISLISNRNEIYQGGVVIIPSYLAKGLEFDAVLVNSVEEGEYSKEEDRRLLYTICTRALHELYLYYFENMSGLIKKIDTSLMHI